MPRILVAVLNWGLGHATRCIPVIRALQQNGAEVIIASDGLSLKLLQTEFPSLPAEPLPPYNIRYTGKHIWLDALTQAPHVLKQIKAEQLATQNLLQKHGNITAIISDNRYGCYHSQIPSVIITHQVFLHLPHPIKWLQPLVQRFNRQLINKFNYCWIPDWPQPQANLSGELAHKHLLPTEQFVFVGPLSRFNYPDDNNINNDNASKPYFSSEKNTNTAAAWSIVALVSGPEPLRTQFEAIMQNQLLAFCATTNQTALLLQGQPQNNSTIKPHPKTPLLQIAPHLPTQQLQHHLKNAQIIIARSGYSTVMDLAVLQKKAIFCPTPGQTEQLYLAKQFMKKQFFYTQPQHRLNIAKALEEAVKYQGLPAQLNPNLADNQTLLNKAINNLLSKH